MTQDDTLNNITVTIVDNANNSTATVGTITTRSTQLYRRSRARTSRSRNARGRAAPANADTGVARWDNSATGDNNSDTIASVTFNSSKFWRRFIVAFRIDCFRNLYGDRRRRTRKTTPLTPSATVVDNAGNSTGQPSSVSHRGHHRANGDGQFSVGDGHWEQQEPSSLATRRPTSGTRRRPARRTPLHPYPSTGQAAVRYRHHRYA